MTGQSGAKKHVDKSKFGAKKMTIDRHTHWYVRRFLAHMIAYRDADKKPHSKGLVLNVFTNGGGKSIHEIAKKTKSDEVELKKYNKWLKSGAVPSDKSYAVLIPKKGVRSNYKGGHGDSSTPIANGKKGAKNASYPSLLDDPNNIGTIFIKINGLPCILAKRGDTMETLASKSQLRKEKLARYNDLAVNARIEEGNIYYLKKKRNKGHSYFHTMQRDESLWDVSQKFGIKLDKLAKLNRVSIKPGRVLWLHDRRPEGVAVEIKELPMLPVDEAIPLKEVIKQHQEDEKIKMDTIRIKKHHDEIIVAKEERTNVEIQIVEHTVQAGESLYVIAGQFGVTVSDLIEWNTLKNTSLAIGQVLVIHGKRREKLENVNQEESTEKPLNIIFHIVAPGDTMYSISRQYSVSVNDLLRMNQKDNFDLSIGERLTLKQ